jgi:hypothetical protein
MLPVERFLSEFRGGRSSRFAHPVAILILALLCGQADGAQAEIVEKALIRISEDARLRETSIAFSGDGRNASCVVTRAGNDYVLVGDETRGPFKEAHGLTFSPSGTLAWVTFDGERQSVHVEKEVYGGYEAVSAPVFDAQGKHFAFSASKPGASFMVLDGKKGPEFEEVGTPWFDPIAGKLAYVARKDGSWVLMCDQRPMPLDAEDVGYSVCWKPTGDALVLKVMKQGKWFPFFDGKRQGTGLQEIADLVWSPSAGSFAYAAREDGRWRAVGAPETHHSYDSIGRIYTSRKGRTAFGAFRNGKAFLILDGQEVATYDGVGDVEFDPSGAKCAYIGRLVVQSPFKRPSTKSFLVVDGVKAQEFDNVFLPRYSPDGSDVAYGAATVDHDKGEIRAFVKCGRYQSPTYDGIGTAPIFLKNGSHVGFGALRGNTVYWVEGRIKE